MREQDGQAAQDGTEGQQGPGRRWWRPGPADRIILAHGLASCCYGLIFPYTAIYLAGKPGVGTGGVAAYYAVTGSAGLVAALLIASGRVTLPLATLGVLGNALWLAGYLAIAAADSLPVVIAAAAAIGAGQGCFLAAVIPVLNSLISPAERRRVFARRYAILNVTLAVGSLAAGALTALLPRSVITYLFVANAVGIIPVALAQLAAGRHIRRATLAQQDAADDARPADRPGRGSVLAALKPALPVMAFQLGVYLLCFSQFEAVAPLVARRLMDLPLYSVSVMLAINVLVIFIAQRPVTRLLERWRETTGLAAGLALWVAAFVIAGTLALGPYPVRLAGLWSFAIVFGLGECAYSCSFYPWLISSVDEADLPRATALANSAMGIGIMAGPTIGVGLILSGSATVVWLSLAASCGAVLAGTALAVRRSRGPAT